MVFLATPGPTSQKGNVQPAFAFVPTVPAEQGCEGDAKVCRCIRAQPESALQSSCNDDLGPCAALMSQGCLSPAHTLTGGAACRMPCSADICCHAAGDAPNTWSLMMTSPLCRCSFTTLLLLISSQHLHVLRAKQQGRQQKCGGSFEHGMHSIHLLHMSPIWCMLPLIQLPQHTYLNVHAHAQDAGIACTTQCKSASTWQ